jgi:hypothetical protein
VRKINKKIILPLIAAAIMTGIVAGTGYVYAEDENPQNTLVQKIAQRFGLNEAEVEAVFDEDRSERQAEMQARFADRLIQAVSDGEITEAQKQLILDKHEEMQTERETEREQFRNMTAEERRSQMQVHRQELETWAETNGIDMENLFGFGGPKGGGMHRGPMM